MFVNEIRIRCRNALFLLNYASKTYSVQWSDIKSYKASDIHWILFDEL